MLWTAVALGAKAAVTFCLLTGTSRQLRTTGTLFALDIALAPVVVQDQCPKHDLEEPTSAVSGNPTQGWLENLSWAVWVQFVLAMISIHWAPIAVYAMMCHMSCVLSRRRTLALRHMTDWLEVIAANETRRRQ